MNEDNNQQEQNNENFDMHQAQQMANDYARNIHQQLLQYRGMLKQLSGQSKLTNNSKSAEKAKIKKAIATLQNMLTNPQLIQKRVTQSLQQQQMINEYVKQLEAEQAAEKSSNGQENIEKTSENTIDTSEQNSDNK
jgi:hypothetical protein